MSVPTFTGSETPSDVAQAAIKWFSQTPNSIGVTIFHENSIPKMKYEFQGGNVEYVCIYRLDKMLESFYSDAEAIFAENAKAKFVVASERAILVPYIAFTGMATMLSQLVVLLAEVFLGALEDTRMMTAATTLRSLVAQSQHKSSLSRPASKVIQTWIDDRVAATTKKKRDYLVGFMNSQPLLHIPTRAGRPPGSIKSEEKKRQEAVEFETRIETVIRDLYSTTGAIPTKTAVAETFSIGPNALRIFIAKTKRLKIDYEAIVERVKGSLNNSAN